MTDLPKDPADPNAVPGGNDKNPTVPRTTYDDAVTEAKNAKARAAAAEAKLAEIDAKKRADEEAEAIKRGEFEKVATSAKAEAEAAKAETAKLKAEQLEARKLGAFLRGLGGELGEQFYQLVDVNEIKADAEGKIDQSSLKKYTDNFRTTYATVIGKPGGNTPPGGKPGGMGGPGLTVEEWKALPLKEQKARMKEVMESRKAAAKK